MEQQAEQQAASRMLAVETADGLTSGRLAQDVIELVEDLAELLSVRGMLPGHIKAMVEEGDEFAMLNCTHVGRTRTRFSPGWEAYSPRRPVLRISVIVVGLEEGRAEEAMEEALSGSSLGFEELAGGSS